MRDLTKTEQVLYTEKEDRLIKVLRTVPHGKVEVFMEKGVPVRIVKIEKSILL